MVTSGGMESIQLHTFGLARHAYMMLSCLQHNNGQPVARLYCDTEYQDPSTQGPLLNFNLLDAHGDIVGYSKVITMGHNVFLVCSHFT